MIARAARKRREISKRGCGMTPIRAIRAKCMECSNGQFREVRLCPMPGCPLYPYRMGHRPKKEGLAAENQPEAGRAES